MTGIYEALGGRKQTNLLLVLGFVAWASWQGIELDLETIGVLLGALGLTNIPHAAVDRVERTNGVEPLPGEALKRIERALGASDPEQG